MVEKFCNVTLRMGRHSNWSTSCERFKLACRNVLLKNQAGSHLGGPLKGRMLPPSLASDGVNVKPGELNSERGSGLRGVRTRAAKIKLKLGLKQSYRKSSERWQLVLTLPNTDRQSWITSNETWPILATKECLALAKEIIIKWRRNTSPKDVFAFSKRRIRIKPESLPSLWCWKISVWCWTRRVFIANSWWNNPK